MGFSKQRQREIFTAGAGVGVQALTQASTATQVVNHGVTTITSAGSGTAANHGFILQSPVKGIPKTLLVDCNSTRTVTVYAESTATTFFGSTTNSVVFSTGTGLRHLDLVGLSTSQWGITSQSSTGLTLVGSTVSG